MSSGMSFAGGREVGTSATHRMRKGTIGEWRSVLSDKEKELAWRVVCPELERFGYTKDGECRDGVEGILTAQKDMVSLLLCW